MVIPHLIPYKELGGGRGFPLPTEYHVDVGGGLSFTHLAPGEEVVEVPQEAPEEVVVVLPRRHQWRWWRSPQRSTQGGCPPPPSPAHNYPESTLQHWEISMTSCRRGETCLVCMMVLTSSARDFSIVLVCISNSRHTERSTLYTSIYGFLKLPSTKHAGG